jgi:NAD(P)-dependent dehydrogenase (short-subunit alcohol dehydrogenase family)
MQSFAGQVVVITGAGSGIGRQFARAFAKEGASVAAIDRQPAGLDELAAELRGSKLAIAVADVTDRDGIASAVADLESRLGPTDILIANAGIFKPTPAAEFNAADYAAVINVNLIGVANSMAAVLPGMVRRGRGHLVAISSLASFRGLPTWAAYCSSKAGVVSLCDAFRVELKPRGIAVTTICPGFIKTNIGAGIETPKNLKMMDVGDAVNRMMPAIRARKRFFSFPGSAVRFSRFVTLAPRAVSDFMIARKVRGITGKPLDAPR